MHVMMIGGSGFLGSYVARALTAKDHDLTLLTRQPIKRRELAVQKSTRLKKTDVYDVDALTEAFESADAVVSMAGILNESGRDGSGFDTVHVELVKGIIEACKNAGVRRVLHVSAIGAGEGKSHYLRSKGEAESLLTASGLDVTLYRPSVIFGPGDSFFNRFADLLAIAPALPLACAEARLQPVYARDVATAMALTLDDPASYGSTLELGGPQQYSLKELVDWTAKIKGLKRWIPPLPDALSRLQASLMDFVPGKPFSTDNYLSLQSDNITTNNALPKLGIRPSSIESIVPDYLGVSERQRRLNVARRDRYF